MTTGRSREDENEAPLSRSQGFDAERDGQVAEKLGWSVELALYSDAAVMGLNDLPGDG